MEASSASRVLLIALCLWSCTLSTGEAVATEEAESMLNSARARESKDVDVASQPLIPTADPKADPGRRRRVDQRRRTHMPEPTKMEAEATQELKKAAADKAADAFLKGALTKAKDEQTVETQQKRVKWDAAKATIDRELSATKETHRKAEKMLEQKDKLRRQANVAKAQLAETQAKEEQKAAQSRTLRATLSEAQEAVNEAFRFVKMVSAGRGMEAFRSSFVFDDLKKSGLGGPGGLAALQGDQFNIPWLVKLNAALLEAKKETNYANMLNVQQTLDLAEGKVGTLENKWKRDEEHRASVANALEKDKKEKEVKGKRAAAAEVVKKREEELKAKEVYKKSEISRLKARTAKLMREAEEMEDKAMMALEKNPKELAEGNNQVSAKAAKAKLAKLEAAAGKTVPPVASA